MIFLLTLSDVLLRKGRIALDTFNIVYWQSVKQQPLLGVNVFASRTYIDLHDKWFIPNDENTCIWKIPMQPSHTSTYTLYKWMEFISVFIHHS